MIAPFRSTAGIAYPCDMTVLKQVFERTCEEHDIVAGSLDAEDLARAAMSLFGSGVHDEYELMESLRKFIDRRSGKADHRPERFRQP